MKDYYQGKIQKKNIKYNLIYRASRDGDYTTKFQEKCKGHFHQLVCIKTTDLNIFGGYTDIGFQSRAGGIYNDDEAFVFSFDKKKYIILKKEKKQFMIKVIMVLFLEIIMMVIVYSLLKTRIY